MFSKILNRIFRNSHTSEVCVDPAKFTHECDWREIGEFEASVSDFGYGGVHRSTVYVRKCRECRKLSHKVLAKSDPTEFIGNQWSDNWEFEKYPPHIDRELKIDRILNG